MAQLVAVLAVAATLFLGAGCSGFNRAARQASGYGVVSDGTTSFSGTRVIRMSPAPVGGAVGTFSSCCRIGLAWTPKVPDGAFLQVELEAIAAIHSVALNVDGRITELQPVDQYTRFGVGDSGKGFYIPWADLVQIPEAKVARIQIVTLSSGSVTGDLARSDGGMFIDFVPAFISAVRNAGGSA